MTIDQDVYAAQAKIGMTIWHKGSREEVDNDLEALLTCIEIAVDPARSPEAKPFRERRLDLWEVIEPEVWKMVEMGTIPKAIHRKLREMAKEKFDFVLLSAMDVHELLVQEQAVAA